MKKGYVHVYTGNGKGKTTAALGLAIRAAGHGHKIFIGQFMKGQFYGELASLKLIPQIDIEQFGDEGCIQKQDVTLLHKEHALKGLKKIMHVMESGEYEVIIMDEICVAIWFEIISLEDVLSVLNKKRDQTELILTGRKAPKEIIKIADLVTEMKEVKHYYTQGIISRDGIER